MSVAVQADPQALVTVERAAGSSLAQGRGLVRELDELFARAGHPSSVPSELAEVVAWIDTFEVEVAAHRRALLSADTLALQPSLSQVTWVDGRQVCVPLPPIPPPALNAAGPAASSGPSGQGSSWAHRLGQGAWNELLATARMVRDLLPVASRHQDSAPGAWHEFGLGLWQLASEPSQLPARLLDLETLEREGGWYWTGGMLAGAAGGKGINRATGPTGRNRSGNSGTGGQAGAAAAARASTRLEELLMPGGRPIGRRSPRGREGVRQVSEQQLRDLHIQLRALAGSNRRASNGALLYSLPDGRVVTYRARSATDGRPVLDIRPRFREVEKVHVLP
ncbi:MAG: hypothetical protein JJT89_02625 [Nitriliruptoraceae bacterium]|nr:hypothetical protein [Nitriliruptoraceae bacterium]